jgi:hypothetical protein
MRLHEGAARVPKPGFLTFRVPPALLESARERAAAEDRSLSATVRVALREYVARDEPTTGDDRVAAFPVPVDRA